ncbi:MAG TPA: hypothetical protein VGP99_08665 [Tepidisphaeraceae bacterium]|jgi:hypothetical protein|nr:hypothetical protein [Tepidisphaeraceae bacterium]
MWCRILTGLMVVAGLCSGAGADEAVSLSNGIIQFTPPFDPWVVSWVSPKGEAAIYTNPGKGRIQMSAILNIAPRSKEAEEPTRQVLLAELRGLRNKAKVKENVEIVKPLEFEKDDRFFCVLREQFGKDGKVFEQTHYYRNLPPHQFIVTVVSLSEAEDAKSLREAAEKVSLSAALVPKGEKAPPPPKLGAEVAAAKTIDAGTAEKSTAPDRTDLAAAQKELEAAIAKCEAELAKDPKYKSAKSKADAAEKKLNELRAQQPPDRAAIAQASEEWLEAKRPVEAMRQAALAKDADVIAARKKVADARAKK